MIKFNGQVNRDYKPVRSRAFYRPLNGASALPCSRIDCRYLCCDSVGVNNSDLIEWAERAMQELQEFCDDAQVAAGDADGFGELVGVRALMTEFEAIKCCVAGNDKDALRYRFLRNQNIDVIHKGGVFAGLTPDNVALTGVELDMAVDVRRRMAFDVRR